MLSKSFLQTDMWGAFRETQGWHAHKVGDVLVLERPLPMGKTLLYAPEVAEKPAILLELLPKIYALAKRRNALFFRLELNIPKNDPLAEEWQAAFSYTGFVKAFESIQPDDRQIVTLPATEEELLAQMKQKGRYNIRVAEKAGVQVRESTKKSLAADVDIFYTIFQDTAKRDKFSIRPKSYFEGLTEMLYEHNAGRLFIASHENTPLAAAIITLHDGVASYLYGASSSQQRQVMAPYAMHFAAMQWAMSLDAKTYDLLAIKPDTDKKHAYDGITRFKQQFGGEAVHLMGSFDLVLEPLWYTLFTITEKIRR
jgi:lipid II:glycine glycyltransferase (peptidoglycan interpeptide bridge formation enzyme)